MTDTERTEIVSDLLKHAKLALGCRQYSDACALLDMYQRLSFGMSMPAGLMSGVAVRDSDSPGGTPRDGEG
jgi:hypothetical protein